MQLRCRANAMHGRMPAAAGAVGSPTRASPSTCSARRACPAPTSCSFCMTSAGRSKSCGSESTSPSSRILTATASGRTAHIFTIMFWGGAGPRYLSVRPPSGVLPACAQAAAACGAGGQRGPGSARQGVAVCWHRVLSRRAPDLGSSARCLGRPASQGRGGGGALKAHVRVAGPDTCPRGTAC